MKVLNAASDSEAQYQQLILEAISDINDPLENPTSDAPYSAVSRLTFPATFLDSQFI